MSDEQETVETTDVATRDELIAAVKEAGGTESLEETPEVSAAPTPEPAKTEPEPAPEDPEARLSALLAKRREGHEQLTAAQMRAQRLLQEAEETKQRLIEEARAEARRAAQEEREKLRLDFRSRPVETLRELGDPDEVVETVLKAGTPEAKALAKAQEEARAAREEAKDGKTAREELEKFKRELAAEKQYAQQAQVRQEYLTQYASPEKAPYMHARWDAEEIFQRSVALARQWANQGLEYKKDFDDGTIAEYLELQSKKRITAVNGTPANQVPAGAPAKEPGLAPKVSANAPRTLSAAAGSERRTSPRPFHEMTEADRRKALMEEVAAARKANPDSAF